MPEASVASRFLEEVPPQLLEDLGSPRRREPAIPADRSMLAPRSASTRPPGGALFIVMYAMYASLWRKILSVAGSDGG